MLCERALCKSIMSDSPSKESEKANDSQNFTFLNELVRKIYKTVDEIIEEATESFYSESEQLDQRISQVAVERQALLEQEQHLLRRLEYFAEQSRQIYLEATEILNENESAATGEVAIA